MENKKVVLPQNVAGAIESLRKKGWENHHFLNIEWLKEYVVPGNNSHTILNYVRKEGFEPYFTAIINGYEVEKVLTPEEKIMFVWVEAPTLYPEVNSRNTYRFGIKKCLEALGIEIEGVNK